MQLGRHRLDKPQDLDVYTLVHEPNELRCRIKQLILVNHDLLKAVDESKSHLRSVYILSSLLFVCMVASYGFHMPHNSPYNNHTITATTVTTVADPNPELYPLQQELSKLILDNDDPLDEYFYASLCVRVNQLFFDAFVIRSDFILHDQLGQKPGVRITNLLAKTTLAFTMPLMIIPYAFAEHGVRELANLNLDSMAQHTSRFVVLSGSQFAQDLAVHVTQGPLVKDVLADIKAEFLDFEAADTSNMSPEEAEAAFAKETEAMQKATAEVDVLANEYAMNFGKMLAIGFASGVWQDMLHSLYKNNMKLSLVFEGMVQLLNNHPLAESVTDMLWGSRRRKRHENHEKGKAINEWLSKHKMHARVWRTVADYFLYFKSDTFMKALCAGTTSLPGPVPSCKKYTMKKPSNIFSRTFTRTKKYPLV